MNMEARGFAGIVLICASLMPGYPFNASAQMPNAILNPDLVGIGAMGAATNAVNAARASAISQSAKVGFSMPAPASGLFGRSQSISGAAPAAPLSVLIYTPSAEVRARVRQHFIEASTKSNPAARAQFEQALAHDAALTSFNQLLANYGYSSTNLADVMTAYYVICWEVVNGADASGNSSGIRAVNTQLRNALLGNPSIQQLSDADKQQTAELMAYQTVIAGSAKNELIKRGDQAGLQQLRQSVRQGVLQMGVDLSRLKLTNQGFVPAS